MWENVIDNGQARNTVPHKKKKTFFFIRFTISQYCLNTMIQVFGELQGKLQDILRAVKAIVAARKKTRGAARTADGMDAEY